jgi:hypothetical protein
MPLSWGSKDRRPVRTSATTTRMGRRLWWACARRRWSAVAASTVACCMTTPTACWTSLALLGSGISAWPASVRRASTRMRTAAASAKRLSRLWSAEEALLRPRGTQDPRSVHRRGRDHRLDQPAQAAALPVHLAQDPGRRRRAHPALLRARHPPIPGDLLQDVPGHRPSQLRHRDRPVLGDLTSLAALISHVAVSGSLKFLSQELLSAR